MNTLPINLLLGAVIAFGISAQPTTSHQKSKSVGLKFADDFLIDSSRKPTPVMLLGVWHFDYPNADSHKISTDNMVDVLSTKRQEEVAKVVALLRKFNPTKICLESGSQKALDDLYESFKLGKEKNNRNEVVQLGMRLAQSLKHSRVFAVDASNYASENASKNPEINKLWDEQFQLDASKYEGYSKAYDAWNTYSNSLLKEQSILDQLLYENDPRNLKRSYGQYMVSGWLKTTNNNGPDALALQWYNRNLRIFNNIMKTNPTAADRVLVIFGRGHIPLLQHSIEASPEFELVPFDQFVKAHKK